MKIRSFFIVLIFIIFTANVAMSSPDTESVDCKHEFSGNYQIFLEIDVLAEQKRKVGKVIVKDREKVKQEFDVDKSYIHESGEEFETNNSDFNFDGHPDFEVVVLDNGRVKTAQYYIWKPEIEEFEYLGYYHQLKLDEKTKTLSNSQMIPHEPNFEKTFKFIDGALTLIESN